MKISVFSISGLAPGKYPLKDSRLDEAERLTGSKKKTYVQVEVVGEDAVAEADVILVPAENRADLILRDLEFVENRLSRSEGESEKSLLAKLKGILEKEEFILSAGLSPEEQKAIAQYGLLTDKPVAVAQEAELGERGALLAKAVAAAGYISFFTAGEKESRAWLVRKGASAWEASGAVHSDIQKGFIRAEIIGCNDFINAGGEAKAKQAGKMRLEPKEYLIQDGDVANFRFNK